MEKYIFRCLLGIFLTYMLLPMTASAQSVSTAAFPNSFTLNSAIPHGCLFIDPTTLGTVPPSEDISFDTLIDVNDGDFTARFLVRVWRIGCHEPNRSIIILNIRFVAGDDVVRTPIVRIVNLDTNEKNGGSLFYWPPSVAFALPHNATSRNRPESTVASGHLYIVDPGNTPTDVYNFGNIALELLWPDNQIQIAPVFPYDSELDATQFLEAPLHGRYTGQWTVAGLPRSGLVLQIGEVEPERNFVFAIWFTYLDGAPTWVVGNVDFALGDSEVEIPMSILDGGGFITNPGSFTGDDVAVNSVGTMTLRAIHCNALEADIDFTAGGLGQQSIELRRIIRVAGFDCDQTQ